MGEKSAELPLFQTFFVGLFGRNPFHPQMFHDRIVERLITRFFADLNHAGNLVGLGFTHEVRDGGIENEDFQRGDAAFFINALEQILREIEIRCEPRQIPDSIDVDVSNLAVHDVVHVSDLPVGEGIEILAEPDQTVATVGTTQEEEVATPAEAEEPAEPEVIGKGKKEDEE